MTAGPQEGDLPPTARRARAHFARLGGKAAPPGDDDAQRLARALLRSARRARRRLDPAEAAGLARTLVAEAGRAVEALDGAPDWRLDPRAAMAVEAVLRTRGRPALRIYDAGFEDPGDDPENALWAEALRLHDRALRALAAATAAVMVAPDDPAGHRPWVQGTAVLIAPGLALTNRHVLFPPAGGLALARRFPGSTAAAPKPSLRLALDCAQDDGTPGRGPRLAVTGIAFVAAPADPVDAALVTVAGNGPAPVPVAADDRTPDDLCVIGHPGRMAGVPDPVWQVFGRPDERKRLSFGEAMGTDGPDLLHDASTIGGYSGAAVSGLAEATVRALHYWGDPATGNRAIRAAALRAHPVLGPFLR
jgi:hypothetical protein